MLIVRCVVTNQEMGRKTVEDETIRKTVSFFSLSFIVFYNHMLKPIFTVKNYSLTGTKVLQRTANKFTVFIRLTKYV